MNWMSNPTARTPARSNASSRSACRERLHGQPVPSCRRKCSIEHSSISTTTTWRDGAGSQGRHWMTVSKIASSAAASSRSWVQSQASHDSAAMASNG